MSGYDDTPGGFASLGAGLGHGFGTTMLGAQQLIGRALGGLGSTSVGPWLTNDAESGLRNLDAQYAPAAQAYPLIAGAGDFGGQMVASYLPVSKLDAGFSALSLPAKIGIGAAQGGIGAAMMPVVSQADQSYWAQKAKQIASMGLWDTLIGPTSK